mgnify:CR=1 FL=1
MLNRDYSDLLSAFSRHRVEYLLVGAYAMAVHGQPRATMDIDLWLRVSPANAASVSAALAEFGAPLEALAASNFLVPGTVVQIGVAPRRIDLLTRIDGVDFDAASARAASAMVGELRIPVIALDDLITNKRATGRAQDRIDAERLAQLHGPAP